MKHQMSIRLRSVLVASMLNACVLLGGCAKDLPQRVIEFRKPNGTESGYIRENNDVKEKRRLIVFVHGIFGDARGTWCHSNGSCLFDLLVNTSEFADFDVFVFGYPSAIFAGGTFSVSEAAVELQREMEYRQIAKKYDEIVFVAHSMGGLAALELLTMDPTTASKTPLIVSYGTPYQGAHIAEWAGGLIQDPALRDLTRVEVGNGFLQSLSNRWKRQRYLSSASTKIRCSYEKLAVPPLSELIVPETSANNLCDDVSRAIAEDHIGMVKPDGGSHASYKELVTSLRELNGEQRRLPRHNGSPNEDRVETSKVRVEYDDRRPFDGYWRVAFFFSGDTSNPADTPRSWFTWGARLFQNGNEVRGTLRSAGRSGNVRGTVQGNELVGQVCFDWGAGEWWRSFRLKLAQDQQTGFGSAMWVFPNGSGAHVYELDAQRLSADLGERQNVTAIPEACQAGN